MSSNMERVAAMPDASLYVNRDGRRADDCVDSHGGGNLTKIPRSGGGSQKVDVRDFCRLRSMRRFVLLPTTMTMAQEMPSSLKSKW